MCMCTRVFLYAFVCIVYVFAGECESVVEFVCVWLCMCVFVCVFITVCVSVYVCICIYVCVSEMIFQGIHEIIFFKFFFVLVKMMFDMVNVT